MLLTSDAQSTGIQLSVEKALSLARQGFFFLNSVMVTSTLNVLHNR